MRDGDGDGGGGRCCRPRVPVTPPLLALLLSRCAASYGGLARYPDIRRIKIVGGSAVVPPAPGVATGHTLVAASGEYSDFQALSEKLDALV
jgi:hypothetical protein